jgi:hypothetical protein
MTRYFISDSTNDLDVLVADDADMDGAFDALCLETGEVLRINGWQATAIEAIGEGPEVSL